MSNELINKASEIFPSFDHWESFQKLSEIKEQIVQSWLADATEAIREHFHQNPSEDWAFEPFGATHRDTRWYLREFGPDSLGVEFSFNYTLSLGHCDYGKFHRETIVSLLDSASYNPIHQAFSRIDHRFNNPDWCKHRGPQLIEIRNFCFGNPFDGSFSPRQLAWFSGNEKDKFVSQAIEKIKRFMKVTELIRKVNQEIKGKTEAEINENKLLNPNATH